MIFKYKNFCDKDFEEKLQNIKVINESFVFQEDFIFSHVDRISSSSLASTISATSSNEIEGISDYNGLIKSSMVYLLNKNYNDALINIKQNINNIKIAPNFILNLHESLFSNVDKINKKEFERVTPGKFKIKANYVMDENRKIIFTPPTPIETPELIIQLCNWFNKSDLDPILKSIIFIYDFIKIHPFNDGNGRISRLLMNLLLIQSGIEFLKYVPLEKYILENKNEYLKCIFNSQLNWYENKNDYSFFINFHLKAIIVSWERWKEIINFRSNIKDNKINKIGEVLILIKKLRENMIPITKQNIQKQSYYWQSNLKETTLKDIIFDLSKNNILILTKQGRISFYDLNENMFDVYYKKYVDTKVNSKK